MLDETDFLMAREGAAFDFNGQPVIINPGDVIRRGHPILAGREHLFVPMRIKFDLPKDPEPPRPAVSSPRASSQGARSR